MGVGLGEGRAERVPCHPGCSLDMAEAPQSRQCQGALARGHLAGGGTAPRQCTTQGGHSWWNVLEGLADEPEEAGKAIWSVACVAQPGAGIWAVTRCVWLQGHRGAGGQCWAVTATQARASKSRGSEVGKTGDAWGHRGAWGGARQGGCVGEEAEPLFCTVPLTLAFVHQRH